LSKIGLSPKEEEALSPIFASRRELLITRAFRAKCRQGITTRTRVSKINQIKRSNRRFYSSSGIVSVSSSVAVSVSSSVAVSVSSSVAVSVSSSVAVSVSSSVAVSVSSSVAVSVSSSVAVSVSSSGYSISF
jgi:Flp pilus assembly protein TadG